MRFGFLRIGPGFALFFALLYFLDCDGVFAGMTLAALAHEAGHAVLIYVLGGRVFEAELTVGGACIHHSLEDRGWRDMVVAIGGPAFNILSAVIFAGREGLAGVFAASSLLLGIYNMLPVYPLDGGRILKAALRKYKSSSTILTVSALIAVGTLLGGGTIIALKGYGLAVLETGVSTAFVCSCSWRERDV